MNPVFTSNIFRLSSQHVLNNIINNMQCTYLGGLMSISICCWCVCEMFGQRFNSTTCHPTGLSTHIHRICPVAVLLFLVYKRKTMVNATSRWNGTKTSSYVMRTRLHTVNISRTHTHAHFYPKITRIRFIDNRFWTK